MKKIYKVKRVCSVPGCLQRDGAAISGGNGSVCICKDCAERLYRFYFPETARGRKKSSAEDKGGER